MNELKFYIDNVLSKPPLEYRGIELELNFEDINEIRTSISQDSFTFVNENADVLRAALLAGTTGGLGIYWGVPFRIEMDTQIIFDGYIDLVNEAQFSCDKVVCKVREAKTLDWMESIADGFSFDGLYSRGIITDADFLNIPYIQSDIPDYRQAALFFLYTFVITQELVKVVKDIADVSADLAGVFSTPAGVVKAIFLVAYLVALIIALFKLIQQMIEELISPVKYHRGMLVKTHFEKACQSLGLTFQSSLFDPSVPSNINDINGVPIPSGYWANECLIQEKNKEGYKKNKTTNQKGFYNGTFKSFILAMEAKYNARMSIINGVFRFERRDAGTSTQTYQIPDVRRDFYGTNAEELVSNYLVQFQVDNIDLNTVNRYNGTNAKNYITSKTVDATKTELIRGLSQPNILFALGRRKNTLTRVEQLVEDFLGIIDSILNPIYNVAEAMVNALATVVKVINKVIGAINTILPASAELDKLKVPSLNINKSNLAQTIGNRVGMLLLSTDFIGVPKLVLIQGSGWDIKITLDNETKQSAREMWDKYHFIESMVPTIGRPAGNQAYKFDIPVIPFCIDDYYLVRGLNNGNKGEASVVSPDGAPAKILSLKWNIYRNKAAIKYAEEKLFTNNLKEVLLINEGN